MAWAPDYVTATQLKNFVRITDTADDAEVGYAITAASRAIDQATNRQFGNTGAVQERFYTARWDKRRARWVIEIDDVMTSTGLLVHYDSDADETYASEITDYRLKPANASSESRPWTEIVVNSDSTTQPTALEDGIRVTATFGWTSVPTAIVEATLLQASRFLIRRDSPFGIAGSPDQGSEMRLLARVDPDVAVAVTPYRRIWGAA